MKSATKHVGPRREQSSSKWYNRNWTRCTGTRLESRMVSNSILKFPKVTLFRSIRRLESLIRRHSRDFAEKNRVDRNRAALKETLSRPGHYRYWKSVFTWKLSACMIRENCMVFFIKRAARDEKMNNLLTLRQCRKSESLLLKHYKIRPDVVELFLKNSIVTYWKSTFLMRT